uniref:Serpentine receptor class gamma n=1 Tax=Panagrolaimus davidi TaxID=227884 RepID=A0A914R096_9BILA
MFLAHFIFWPSVALFGIQFWREGFFREWYLKNGWFASFIFTLSVYLDNVIYIGQSLIAFNRFTGLWFPLQNKQIWNYKWYIYLTIFLPIGFVANRFTADGYYKVTSDGTLDFGYTDKVFEALTVTITAFTLGASFGISLLLNILTSFKYKKSQNTQNSSSDDKSVKLILYSIMLTVIQCIRFGYNRMRAYFVYYPSIIYIIVTSYSYITAAHAIIAAIGILILSRQTRQIYYKFYFSWLPNCFKIKNNIVQIRTASNLAPI